MGQILRNWRIGAAVIFSVVSIVGAYMLARGVRTPQVAEASAESALLQAIATKDTDGDGLPDWEESLYGTDPRVTDTLKLGMQDGEAVARGLIVPKAIADIPLVTPSPVSLDLDGLPPPPLFMAAKEANGGGDLSEAQMSEVANQALNSLASTVAASPDYKSAKDITVSGSGADVLKSFAVQAEAVLLKNTANATTSELNYLKSAIMNNDTTAIPHIASIAKGYRDSAVGLSMLAVPQELAADHLLLINAMMRVSEVTNDFARVTEDPLATMLALQLYPQAVSNLGTAFIHVGQIYKAAGITLPTGTPGASFVNLIENLVAKQAAKKQ